MFANAMIEMMKTKVNIIISLQMWYIIEINTAIESNNLK